MIQPSIQSLLKKTVFFSVTWIIFSPICFHLIILDDFSDTSQYLCYEVAEQDVSETISEHKGNFSIPTLVVKHPSDVHLFFEHIPDLLLGISAPCSRPLFLRC